MSYGRDKGGLPGQSGRGGDRSPWADAFPKSDSGKPEPGNSGPSGDRPRASMPGGKAGGGGLLMLIFVGIAFFMIMRAPGNGQQKPGQQDQDKGGIVNPKGNWDRWEDPAKKGQGKSRENDSNSSGDRVNIPGLDDEKSDKVENSDGWSMQDSDKTKGKSSNSSNAPFSGAPKKPASDEVTKDGWSTRDSTEKGKKKD